MEKSDLKELVQSGGKTKKVLLSLVVIFAALGVTGLALGIYSFINMQKTLQPIHRTYNEQDDAGNTNTAETWVNPREKTVRQEVEVQHRPGLHANSSTVISDFNTGFRAYRTKGGAAICLVQKMSNSMEEMVDELEADSKQQDRKFVVLNEEINPRVLRATAGDHIADHCLSVKAYWMVPATAEEANQEDTEKEVSEEEAVNGGVEVPEAGRQKRATCYYRFRCYYYYIGGGYWYYRCYYYLLYCA